MTKYENGFLLISDHLYDVKHHVKNMKHPGMFRHLYIPHNVNKISRAIGFTLLLLSACLTLDGTQKGGVLKIPL